MYSSNAGSMLMIRIGRRYIQILGILNFAWATATALIASSDSCAAPSAGDAVQRFVLRIENGRLVDNRKTIQVKRGDKVELNWSADRRTVLHLHGYDIEITADVGRPQTMSFQARATGRFAIETHGDVGSA